MGERLGLLRKSTHLGTRLYNTSLRYGPLLNHQPKHGLPKAKRQGSSFWGCFLSFSRGSLHKKLIYFFNTLRTEYVLIYLGLAKSDKMNFIIKSLSKDLKDDYLFLFDNMIHKENPEWSKCYCNDFHFLGDVETCTRDMSRELIIDRIDTNELQGYLVYADKKPIGWCNVNNRSNSQRLLRDYDLIDHPDDKVCSLVCFLIHPDYRRQGISQKLVERVISDYSDTDYDYIESYPKKGEANATSFKGPIELYKRNKFNIHTTHEAYYVMRRYLKKKQS